MEETVFVLGSNSFSGSHFVAGALAEGYRVIGVSRSPEPHPVFLAYRTRTGLPLGRFQFMQCDVNHDLATLMDRIQADRPAYVVNFIAQGMVAESWRQPEHWFRTNTLAQVLLHDRLRHCTFLKKYVHISTPEVYGSTEGTISETTPFHPSTPYAVSRAATDMSLASFQKAYGFPVVTTRAANVFGPGQQLYRIIPRAALRFLTGGMLQLHGGGDSVRSFIHIRDVVDGTLRSMRQGQPGDIFHLSTRRMISIRDLVRLVADMAGVSFEDHVQVAGERLGKDAAYLLDSGKARRELGWNDDIPLEDGVRETLAWVRENIEELLRQPQEYLHKA